MERLEAPRRARRPGMEEHHLEGRLARVLQAVARQAVFPGDLHHFSRLLPSSTNLIGDSVRSPVARYLLASGKAPEI